MCLHMKGLSSKKNVAVNAAKDSSGNVWADSSVPVVGTLPIRGNQGKRQILCSVCVFFLFFQL